MPSRPRSGPGAEAELPEYAGHYRLEERLGAGGMGVVHLARSAAGLPLAVKVVHAEFARDPEFRGRFRQEVAAARRVSGAFTAPVVDADPDAERPWMATLFIPGLTLADHVKRNGPLTPAQLRHLTAGLAEALRDIHRAGVVHRDLKPSNVLLAEDSAKVIDFGISRPKDSELRTETGKLIGTPPFMAPEQFRRPREVGPAADVFALGSVLVHAATGRGPFDSDSPYLVAYQVVHDEPDVTGVPGELAPLVLRCLAKEPEDRPTPDELMAEVRRMAGRYDTQAFDATTSGAFIPAQREPSEPLWEASKSAGVPGSSVKTEPEPEPESEPEPEPVRSRIRISRRVAVALTGALVLAGALALTPVLLPTADDSAGGQETPAAAPGAFHAWNRLLGSGAAPVCSYGKKALLCTAPGVLAASVDPLDGTVLWLRKAAEGTAGDAPAPAPVLSGGLLQVVTPDSSRLLALDPATGRTRWSMGISAYQGQVQPVGDTVLLAAPDGTVTAVDGATGEQRWQRPLRLDQPALSYVGGDLAYATTVAADGVDSVVTAVDPRTGTVRWQQRSAGSVTPVGVTDGVLWCTRLDTENRAVALVGHRVKDGAAARRVPLQLPLSDAAVTVRQGKAYLLAAGGALVAQDLVSGKQVWRSETSVSRGSAPAVDTGGRVYVTSPDGRLIATDLRTGTALGQTRLRPAARHDRVVPGLPVPVVADGRVYASAPDGTVFGVDGSHPEDW
ncbi:serine/threonine-protein kinase [Streptomyces sp. NPDC050085]|uniref:serine/threonine-protein kinase n=1 Tax=Streptomyces sp. NPDC050085 TaxID=3365600 RepID=UPI00378A6AEB